MRKKLSVLLTIATVSALALPAFAQDNNTAQCGGTSNRGDGPRNQTFCFEGENVANSLVGPEGQRSQILRGLRGTSLLRLRAHFVPEMLRSVENN